MPSSVASLPGRVGAFFGADDPWERPRPPVGRQDVLLAAAVAVLGLASLELVRGIGALEDVAFPWGVQWLAVVTGSALLVGRRRWPLSVATLAATHMLVVGLSMPVVMGQITLQLVYFLAILSGVSWAQDRRWMMAVIGAIVLAMFVWIALQFAVGTAIQEILDDTEGTQRSGLLGPVPATVVLTLLINALYFGGAVLGGQASWRNARQKALLGEQASTISTQTDSLRRRAVTDERLRIARELHDVVGHHVSVMGIQAAAARRVIDRDPEAAAEALGGIERSSREAVTQMRSLLGTLRDVGEDAGERDGRAPEPGVADLASLAAERTASGLATDYDVVESSPGAAQHLSGPLGLSLYRVAQEALANTTRHSTARTARIVLRVEDREPTRYAEVEVLDDGRPRGATSGSGLGHLGMRERAASMRGEVEIGPRPTGGYRVRVRVPLEGDRV
ncbi:MAG TPA: sensor histidine kinase [Ornithinibacter sp.]|nr:sensor histidine kinase [Ornithinibacter sp.]